MTDDENAGESDLDARLRQEGQALRTSRDRCPDPDLLMARGSEVLDEAVRRRLEDHVRTCDACRRLAADIDALALDQADAPTEERVRRRVHTAGHGWNRLWLTAAAVLAATGLGLTWWSLRARQVPEAVVADQPAPPPVPEPVALVTSLWGIEAPAVRLPLSSLGEDRGATDEGRAGLALVDALEPYQSGQYRDAVARLEVVARDHPSSGEAHFYLGVAQLMTGQPDVAATSLDRAARTLPKSRQLEVAWYRATAEQRAGRVDAARALLKPVCAAPGAYQAAACAAGAQLR